jgi:hypothetical protein
VHTDGIPARTADVKRKQSAVAKRPYHSQSGSIEEKKDLKKKLEEAKSAETVLAYRFSGARVEYVDQHVLFRMPGEKTREYFDELFLIRGIRMHEAVTDIQAMGTLAAIEPDPVARAVGTDFV